MKCQFGQCRRPIKYHGMSAMCDIYPRTNNNDRQILFVRLVPLTRLVLVGTVTVLYFQLLWNVERVSLLDMPTHCALYSVSVTVPLL